MLKEKNSQYKLKIRQLEEELSFTKSQNSKLSKEKELAEAKSKFCEKMYEQEVSELKQKLFAVEFELSQLKKSRESVNQFEIIENQNPTIDLGSSDDEEMLDEHDEENSKNNQKIEPSFNELPNASFFKCDLCPKFYIQEKRYRNHLKFHHDGKHPNTTNTIPITPNQRGRNCTVQYRCSFKNCKFTCLYKPAFNRHVKSHELPTFACNFTGCNYTTPYEKRLYNHYNTKHPGIPTGGVSYDYPSEQNFHDVFQDRLADVE